MAITVERVLCAQGGKSTKIRSAEGHSAKTLGLHADEANNPTRRAIRLNRLDAHRLTKERTRHRLSRTEPNCIAHGKAPGAGARLNRQLPAS